MKKGIALNRTKEVAVRITWLVLLLIVIPLSLEAQELIKPGAVLNLSQCVEIALQKNPNIMAARSTIRVSESLVGQAQANYYPQASVSAGYNRFSLATAATDRSFDQYSSNINVSQNIYDFGRTSSQVKIQRLNLRASSENLENVSEQIVLSVQQAYYAVLAAKRNIDVAEQTVKQFQQHLDQAKGFYEVGTRPKIDVTNATVDLSNAQLNLIRAQNAISISRVTLNNVMGTPSAPEYTIEDNLSFQKYTITFQEAIDRAYQRRPDLKAIVATREAAAESVVLARTGFYPFITGSASYNWAGNEFPLEEGWDVGAAVSLPIFNGFLTTYQVQGAKEKLNVLRANEETLRQGILLEVQQAYLNLGNAAEQIPTLELAVTQANETLELANGRYAAGVGSYIEVTDALVAYNNAQAAYIQGLYNYRVAQASLEKAMGVTLP
jgi:outer membrane protein